MSRALRLSDSHCVLFYLSSILNVNNPHTSFHSVLEWRSISKLFDFFHILSPFSSTSTHHGHPHNPTMSLGVFNNLPRELRDQIWEYALWPTRNELPGLPHLAFAINEHTGQWHFVTTTNGCWNDDTGSHQDARGHVALLLTSKAIHEEVQQTRFDTCIIHLD